MTKFPLSGGGGEEFIGFTTMTGNRHSQT